MPIDTELCFFLQRCWFCCADALHCCTLSATLFVVLLFLLKCNKQYACAQNPYPRLEKHADDGHHRKSSVSDFGIKLFGFLSRVRRGQHLESKVSSIRISSWGLFLGDLAESHVGQDLTPSSRVGILGLSTTHINQQKNMLYCHSCSVGLEIINCISSYINYVWRMIYENKLNLYTIWFYDIYSYCYYYYYYYYCYLLYIYIYHYI